MAALVEFYTGQLGFKISDDYAGHPDGRILGRDGIFLVVIPVQKPETPDPFHFALEIDCEKEFLELFERLKRIGLNPRCNPSLDSESCLGQIELGGARYQKFYFSDPAGSLVEIMRKDLIS